MANSEEQNRYAIPTPRFAESRRLEILTLRRKGVYSQNHMVDPWLQVSEPRLHKFPTPSTFSC